MNANTTNELYLVTGAAGNLGSAIVRQLVHENKPVRSFVLRGEEAARHLPAGANVIEGDVTDIASLETLFSDIPENTSVYCIHCAAMVSVSNLVADKIWHVNVDGTQYIIDKCREHNARLIFIGSTGAIPEEPKGTAIREVEHFDPNAVIGLYDQTKAAACQLVLDAIHRNEIDGCLILPSGISGPGDYTFGNVAGVIKEYVEGKMPAGVEGTFNCGDNRDMSDAILRACKDGRNGESYVLGGDMIGMKEVFDILSQRTGLPTIKRILPAGLGKLMGSISDLAETLTHKPQRMTSFAVYNLVRNNEFDSSKAIRELGYNPRPMAQSIADEIDWMLAEGIVTLPEKKDADRSLAVKIAETGTQLGEDIAKGVVGSYKAVEQGVVGGYKAIEHTVVDGYKTIENTVVDGYKTFEAAFVENAHIIGESLLNKPDCETGNDVAAIDEQTAELSKKYPVEQTTTIQHGMETTIQNRLLQSFEDYRQGNKTWVAWGDSITTPHTMYHLHGVSLTLPEYQSVMNLALLKNDIQIGKLHNMILNDNWAALRYDLTVLDRKSGESKQNHIMEFVRFETDGDGQEIRVAETWIDTKGEDYENLLCLLTEEERKAHDEAYTEVLNRKIPKIDVLAVRYPVRHPTSIRTAQGREIRQAILQDFECWNRGFDAWKRWAMRTMSEDFVCHTDFGDADREQYVENSKLWFGKKNAKRLYFDNLIVRDNWAAIHYRLVYWEDGIKKDKSMMQFIRFAETEDGVRIAEVWNK